MGFFDTINKLAEQKGRELLLRYEKELRKCTNDQLVNQLHTKTSNGASYEVIDLINKEMQRRGLA